MRLFPAFGGEKPEIRVSTGIDGRDDRNAAGQCPKGNAAQPHPLPALFPAAARKGQTGTEPPGTADGRESARGL